MAKTTPAKKLSPTKKIASKAIASTPVRNSAIPRTVAAAKKKIEITTDMISLRAYEIHTSGNGGSELDNWFSAERELRGSI